MLKQAESSEGVSLKEILEHNGEVPWWNLVEDGYPKNIRDVLVSTDEGVIKAYYDFDGLAGAWRDSKTFKPLSVFVYSWADIPEGESFNG